MSCPNREAVKKVGKKGLKKLVKSSFKTISLVKQKVE